MPEEGAEGLVPPPPRGWAHLARLSPCLLRLASQPGSGERPLTPPIGSLHGYALGRSLIAAAVLERFVNREVGRATARAGSSSLHDALALAGGGLSW